MLIHITFTLHNPPVKDELACCKFLYIYCIDILHNLDELPLIEYNQVEHAIRITFYNLRNNLKFSITVSSSKKVY